MGKLEDGGLSDGEQEPDYKSESGAESGEVLKNPHIDESSEQVNATAVYEFAYQLASAGRVDSLDVQRGYLAENGICTETELDELTALCLTVRIGQLINSVDVIKKQIEYIRGEIGCDYLTGDDEISEINQLIVGLHHRRKRIIQSIGDRKREARERVPLEQINLEDFET